MGPDYRSSKVKWNPAEANKFVNDEYSIRPSGYFSCSSVVGMMLYLARHTHPYIPHVVNCCECYMLCFQHSHEFTLKRIGLYLKGIITKGFIIKYPKELCNIDWHTDSDFVGMYEYENPTDPSCIKSGTGYWITIENLQVLWKYKLQTKTAMSTMDSNVIVLQHKYRELFPIMDIAASLREGVRVPMEETMMKVSIHKYNTGALILV